MRVVVVNAQVPFVRGGAEILADGLISALSTAGHEAELVRIPFKWYPPQAVLDGIVASRLIDLTNANGQPIDKLITLKFPTYLAPHPNKTMWLVHQHRSAYDLWDTGTSDLNDHPLGGMVRQAIQAADAEWIPEHRKIFAISNNIVKRLQRDISCTAEVLYPPVSDAALLQPLEYDDFFLLPSRVNLSKRQHIFVNALTQCKTRAKIVIVGRIEDKAYHRELMQIARDAGREQDIQFLDMVSRDELIDLYNRCCGVLFAPHDEDYGYVTLEAFHAGKAVVTCEDSGGPLEFVTDGDTGFVARLDDSSVVDAMDKLWSERQFAKAMGARARDHIDSLNISWPVVVEKLLAK